MKVVKRTIDNVIMYRQEPEFEEGRGILNCVALSGGKAGDYYETTIDQAEWDTFCASRPRPMNVEEEILKLKTRVDTLEMSIKAIKP